MKIGRLSPAAQYLHSVLFHTGALRVKRRIYPRKHLIILGYHTISTPGFLREVLGIGAPPQDFIQQIRYLAQNHPIISMRSFLDWIDGKEAIPDNSVMITFDDGYQDVYDIAFPICEELGVPATVFVTTGVIDTGKSIWTNRLYYMISRTGKDQVRFPGIADTRFNFTEPMQRKKSALLLSMKLKGVNPKERDDMLREIANSLDVDPACDPVDELPMLTWDQIRELAQHGFEIGSHTVLHPILSHCSKSEQLSELADSKKMIEEQLGMECRTIAYPNGQHGDFNSMTQEIAEITGYRAAFAFYRDRITAHVKRFEVPRHPLFDVPLASFACAVT